MTMKFTTAKYLLLLGLWTTAFGVRGQAPCIDIITGSDWIFVDNDWKDNYTPQELAGPFCIPIQFHNVRDDNGNGGQSQTMADQMTVALINYFAGANFEFRQVASVNYIDDGALLADATLADFAIYEVPGALNVYFVNSLPNLCGTAGAPMGNGDSGVLMTYKSSDFLFQLTTLAHEGGHYFGLRHTFEGSNVVYDPASPYQYYRTAELVDPNPPNGIDDDDLMIYPNNRYFSCEDSPYSWTSPASGTTFKVEIAAGDMVADTPADPRLSYRSRTCTFTSDEFDANNDRYEPEINNLMSYYFGCRNRFTPGQMDRTLFYYLDFIQYELGSCPPVNNDGSLSETVLRMPGGDGVRKVSVSIDHFDSGNCNIPTGIACTPTALTDAQGQFFCSLPVGGAATADVDKEEDDWHSGVTTFDILQINLHRLGIQVLDGWNQIAADANNDGIINLGDMGLLNDLILYKITELPVDGNLDSPWRFFPELIPFLHPNHFSPPSLSNTPFNISTTFPYPNYLGNNFCYATPSYLRNEMGFHAVKVGDVNQSASTQNLVGGNGPDRLVALPELAHSGSIQRGESFTLRLSAERFVDIAAFGIGFYLDTDRVSLEGIETGDLPQFQVDRFGTQRLAQKELRVLWLDEGMEGHRLAADQAFFQLQLRARRDIDRVQDLFQINQKILLPEFFNTRGERVDPKLQLELIRTATAPAVSSSPAEVAVTVFPNPSRETIHFQFQSPQSGLAQIRIYNALGQSVYTTQRAYTVGDNVLGITTLSPSHGGTFFYTIEGPHFQQRGRFTRMPTD